MYECVCTHGCTQLVHTYIHILHSRRCRQSDHVFLNYTNYGNKECELLIPEDIVLVTTYVNGHRCQEDDGRVQLLMVERTIVFEIREQKTNPL